MQGRLGDERPDIVDDQAADRRVRLHRHEHPDQTAHRGPDPVDRVGIEAGDQRRHIGEILGIGIGRTVGQPAAGAAADDIGTDDPGLVGQGGRQDIEIAAVAGQAVDADDCPRRSGDAPFGIGDAVESRRAER